MAISVTCQPNLWHHAELTYSFAAVVIARFRFDHPQCHRRPIFFDPIPKPVYRLDALLVFGKQAVAPDLDDAQPASVFGRHVEHRLYRQAQCRLKKGKGIEQPVAAARCALTDDMRVQGIASPRADRDRMKELVPLPQCQPGVVAVTHSYIRRSAAGHRRVVRAAETVIDRPEFKCAGRRFQVTLIIDQIPACDTRWQVTHEYHRQT